VRGGDSLGNEADDELEEEEDKEPGQDRGGNTKEQTVHFTPVGDC